MKIQIIQQGDRTFLKGYFLGFIPVYYDDGYDGGWTMMRSPIIPENAKKLINRWVTEREYDAKYKASSEKIINEFNI